MNESYVQTELNVLHDMYQICSKVNVYVDVLKWHIFIV